MPCVTSDLQQSPHSFSEASAAPSQHVPAAAAMLIDEMLSMTAGKAEGMQLQLGQALLMGHDSSHK